MATNDGCSLGLPQEEEETVLDSVSGTSIVEQADLSQQIFCNISASGS